MCTGIEIAALLAAAGSAAGYANNQIALNKQDQQNAASIHRQGDIQQQADQQVKKSVADIASSNPADAQSSALNQYLTQLKVGHTKANEGFTSGVSGAYDQAAQDATNNADAFATGKAGLFSRIDAPVTQRQQEGYQLGDLQTSIGQLGNQSSTEEYLNQLKLHSINPNPWLSLTADALGGASKAYASYDGGDSGYDGSSYTNKKIAKGFG